jgi:hypothetical protein
MAKRGAPFGNKNAVGYHSGFSKKPPGANAIVEYKTGVLGAMGVGPMKRDWAKHDATSGATMFLNGGLPKNSHLKSIMYFPKKK